MPLRASICSIVRILFNVLFIEFLVQNVARTSHATVGSEFSVAQNAEHQLSGSTPMPPVKSKM